MVLHSLSFSSTQPIMKMTVFKIFVAIVIAILFTSKIHSSPIYDLSGATLTKVKPPYTRKHHYALQGVRELNSANDDQVPDLKCYTKYRSRRMEILEMNHG